MENKTYTILVVDEEQKSLAIIQRFLKAAGHNIILAASGKIALEVLQIETHSIDLAVINIDMKGINGKDVANECTRRMMPFLLTSDGIAGEDIIGYLSEIRYSFFNLFHKPLDLYKL